MILLLAAALAGAQHARLTVRAPEEGAGPVTCAVRDVRGAPGSARLAPLAQGGWTWEAKPGERLSCRGPGLEPLDVDAAAGTALLAEVSLMPARVVTLEAGWPEIETDIEWRGMAPPATSLLARERVLVRHRLTLPVATAPRLLRLLPAGRSPVSVFIPEGTSNLSVTVPPLPDAGGEIVTLLPAHAYPPVSLELSAGASRITLRADDSGLFRASGLAPGDYALAPRYRGGLVGRPQKITVRAGESSELIPLPLPETGAARVVVPTALCEEPPPPWLWLRHSRLGEQPAPPFLRQLFDEPTCQREIQGLEEGSYEVSLVRPQRGQEVLATAPFAVVRGRSLEVALQPAVQLAGRVTFGPESPAPRLQLQFDLEGRRWTAETDEHGDYAVRLGEPGEYVVTVRASRKLPATQLMRRLEAGEQREDFVLGDAMVVVRALREDQLPIAEPVQVWLTASDGRRHSGAFHPQEEEAARFVGIGYGRYGVTATTPSGLTSEKAQSVQITADSPVGEVDVLLGRHRGLLRVVDEIGAPIPGAQVLVGGSPLPEQEAGVFSLDTVAIGERFDLQAPAHVAVCRTVAESDLPELRVVPEAASEILTLRFAPEVPWESGVLLGLPGSSCAVRLDALDPKTRLDSQLTTVVLHLPPGSYTLRLDDRSHPVVAPGDVRVVP